MGHEKLHGVAVTALERWTLAGLVLLALAKGLLWSAVLPPWYGPDEASHFEYIQLLVENRSLPQGPSANAAIDYPADILCSEANLDLSSYGAFHAEPPFDKTGRLCGSSSADRRALGPLNASAGYTPLYYAAGIPFYVAAYGLAVEFRLDAVRLWSVLLGIIATVFAYLAARWAFAESWWLAVAAAVLFTMQPMNSQQTAIVNNDALLIAVAAAFWWRFFRALRTGVTSREGLTLGSLIGLAYLAKPQGLFLAAVLPVLMPVALKEVPRAKAPLRAVSLAIAAAIPVLVAIGAGFVYSHAAGVSSNPIPSAPGVHGIAEYLNAYTLSHFSRFYLVWITSFWGYFGWFQVDLPSVAYAVIAVAVAAGLAGAAWAATKPGPRGALAVTAALAFIVPAALIQLLELYTFRSSGQLILQGRSFLMVLVPLLILLLLGWQQLFRDAPGRATAAAAVLAALALNLVSVFAMIEGFYG